MTSLPEFSAIPASHALEQGACILAVSDGNATPNYLEIPFRTITPGANDTEVDVGTSANRADGANYKATIVTMRDTPLSVKTFRLVTEEAVPELLPVAARLAELAAKTGYAAVADFAVQFPEGGGFEQKYSVKNLNPFGGDYTGAAGFEFTLVPYGGPTPCT